MTDLTDFLILFGAGLIAGIINSVSSGGSFITYPAMLSVGLAPIQAATTTLAALTPGNLAAVPEYWPEVVAEKRRYPLILGLVFLGCIGGVGLLLWTGDEAFDAIVPWLILGATLLFAISPAVRRWAENAAPWLTDGGIGYVLLLAMSVYLTYFGSGVGNMVLAWLTIRGFPDFLSANAAKNIIMSLGTVVATIAYSIAGYIAWAPLVPVLIGSAISARYASKIARSIPMPALRAFVIAFGLFVAFWQFLN